MGSFCNYANSGFAFLNCFFFGLKHIVEDELYMSEGTKNLASIIHDKWSMNERRICHLLQASPCKLNQSQIRRGDRMMQSSLCPSNSSLTQVFQNNSSWKTVLNPKMSVGTWNWKVCVIHMMPLTRFYTHGCLLLFLSFARVAECLWRSSWNWASVALTFASLREIMLTSTMKGSYLRQCSYEPFKAYEKICLWRLLAIFVCKYLKVQCSSSRHSCFHSDSTHAMDITCIFSA